MSNNSSVSVQVGPGAGVFLFAVFLVLKVTHVIDWSWWFVTLPLWIGPAIFLAFAFFGVLAVLLSAPVNNRTAKKRAAEKRARLTRR